MKSWCLRTRAKILRRRPEQSWSSTFVLLPSFYSSSIYFISTSTKSCDGSIYDPIINHTRLCSNEHFVLMLLMVNFSHGVEHERANITIISWYISELASIFVLPCPHFDIASGEKRGCPLPNFMNLLDTRSSCSLFFSDGPKQAAFYLQGDTSTGTFCWLKKL